MLCWALHGCFCLEQPRSTRLVHYPRWERLLLVRALKLWWAAWWARHYSALTPTLGLYQEFMFGTVLLLLRIEAFEITWLLALSTRKRHICWSNTSKIGVLDRGKLSKSQRESCIVKTTSKKRKNGKTTYSGNRFLKGTQPATQFLKNCSLMAIVSKHRKHRCLESGSPGPTQFLLGCEFSAACPPSAEMR